MTCKPCQIAREVPQYRYHCPACIHCGARLILNLADIPITDAEVTRRRKAVLADWVAHGHSEATMRALVKAREVIGPASPMESVPQPKTKPRSVMKK